MFVKNIVKLSAEFLNLKDVVDYINGDIEASEELLSEVNNLVLAVSMVNNNIASSYIELIAKTKITNCSGLIGFSKISNKSIIEIKKVTSLNGEDLNFSLSPDGVTIANSESCIVEYSYFPDMVSLDDEIVHYLKVNEMVFALGVVGEYLYIKGAIDDAYMWDKRFKSSMFNLIRPKRSIVMPAKRWE